MPKKEITPEEIHKSTRLAVVASAGCGKTEAIVRAVIFSSGRQLILTHTHAGVKSLLTRFRKYGIRSSFYHVETIASFALRVSQAYPATGGYWLEGNTDINYLHALTAATAIFNTSFGKKILLNSFSGIYVDEYQDCSVSQHTLINTLSKTLSTRIFGDPLQGIFDFIDEKLVDWDEDIYPEFEIGNLYFPWRWKETNPELGEWLDTVRKSILERQSIDVGDLPPNCRWIAKNPDEQRKVCYSALNDGMSVVALRRLPNMAHYMAKGLSGRYSSMEEIECRDLIKYCEIFETARGKDIALGVIDFAVTCLTKIRTELKTIKNIIDNNKDARRIRKYRNIYLELMSLAESNDIKSIPVILDELKSIEGANLYRRELWNEMLKCISEVSNTSKQSLTEIGRKIRSKGSMVGRHVPIFAISRPPLIKGLEFGHSIILDADELKPKELYVALTRGSIKLTILSETNIISPEY